jgi:hypothetical protein
MLVIVNILKVFLQSDEKVQKTGGVLRCYNVTIKPGNTGFFMPEILAYLEYLLIICLLIF